MMGSHWGGFQGRSDLFDLHDRKISGCHVEQKVWRNKGWGRSHFRHPVFNEVALRGGRKGMDWNTFWIISSLTR